MPVTTLQCSLGALAVFTGILGLTPHAHLRQILEFRIDIHVLLAVLLCTLVLSRFIAHVNSPPPELRRVSRELSRLVYLVLYLIIGLRIVACMATCANDGIAFDFTMIEPPLRADPNSITFNSITFNSSDDFQALLACGLTALALIRILTLTIYGLGGLQRMRRRNPVATPFPRLPWRVSAASSDIDGRFPEH
jgi:cytochrome b561